MLQILFGTYMYHLCVWFIDVEELHIYVLNGVFGSWNHGCRTKNGHFIMIVCLSLAVWNGNE